MKCPHSIVKILESEEWDEHGWTEICTDKHMDNLKTQRRMMLLCYCFLFHLF